LTHAKDFDQTASGSSTCAFVTTSATKSCGNFNNRLYGIEEEAKYQNYSV